MRELAKMAPDVGAWKKAAGAHEPKDDYRQVPYASVPAASAFPAMPEPELR